MDKTTLSRVEPAALQLEPNAELELAARSALDARLASGHSVRIEAATSRLQVMSPSGQVELTVRCTAHGCVLEFTQSEIQLKAPAKLSVQCDELELQARSRMTLETAGDLRTGVGGDSLTAVTGRARTEADSLELRAVRGDAHVHANDNVRLVGEKILLNSEHERITTREQLRALWKDLGM